MGQFWNGLDTGFWLEWGDLRLLGLQMAQELWGIWLTFQIREKDGFLGEYQMKLGGQISV